MICRLAFSWELLLTFHCSGGLGDEDLDVAVFRFTLGIPGFDDRLIPRVVGVVLGAFLFANHLAGAQPTPDAQVRLSGLSLDAYPVLACHSLT